MTNKWRIGNTLSRRDELTSVYRTKLVDNGNKLMLTRKDNGMVFFATAFYAKKGQTLA